MAHETLNSRIGGNYIFDDGNDDHDEIQSMLDNAIALAEAESRQNQEVELAAIFPQIAETVAYTEVTERSKGNFVSFGRRIGLPTVIAGIAFSGLQVSQANAEPVSPETPKTTYSNEIEKKSSKDIENITDKKSTPTAEPTAAAKSPKKSDNSTSEKEAKADKSSKSDKSKSDKPKADNFITKIQKSIISDSEDKSKKKSEESKSDKPNKSDKSETRSKKAEEKSEKSETSDKAEKKQKKDGEKSQKADTKSKDKNEKSDKSEKKESKKDNRAKKDEKFYPNKFPDKPQETSPTEAPFEFFHKQNNSRPKSTEDKPDSEKPEKQQKENSSSEDEAKSKRKEVEELARQVGIGDKARSTVKKDQAKSDSKSDFGSLEDKIVPLVTNPKPKKPAAQPEPAPSPPQPESQSQLELKNGNRPPKVSSETEKIIDGMSYLSPKKKDFYKNILLDTVAAGAKYPELKVNQTILVAQAGLESGWGQSTLTTKYNAYFGIKVGNWKGAVAKNQTTQEYNSAGAYTIKDSFRAYGSRQESVEDYMRFINTVKKADGSGKLIYQRAIDNADTPEGYAKGLKDSGYATDPIYDKSLVKFAKQQKIAQLLDLERKNYEEHNKQQNTEPAASVPGPPQPESPPQSEVAAEPENTAELSAELTKKYAAYLGAVGINPALVDASVGMKGGNSSSSLSYSQGFMKILNAQASQTSVQEIKPASDEPAESIVVAPVPVEIEPAQAPVVEQPVDNSPKPAGDLSVPFDPNTFVSPVPPGTKGAVMTAGYGKYPSGGAHWGIDLARTGGGGWDILSICTGTVEDVKINKKYANKNAFKVSGSTNYVWIKCDSGEYVGYAHMNEKDIKDYIKPGSRIKATTVIGAQGNQGNSSGAHLHLQINGKSIKGNWYSSDATKNPSKFLADRGVKMPKPSF